MEEMFGRYMQYCDRHTEAHEKDLRDEVSLIIQLKAGLLQEMKNLEQQCPINWMRVLTEVKSNY